MEITVLEETPKRVAFEVKGSTHSLCNPLKVELWENKHVKVATYSMKHPLLPVPRMIVETDGEVKPRKVLADAAAKLAEAAGKLKKDFKKVK